MKDFACIFSYMRPEIMTDNSTLLQKTLIITRKNIYYRTITLI